MKKKQSYMDTTNILSEGLLTRFFDLFTGRGSSELSREERALMKSRPFKKALRGFYSQLKQNRKLMDKTAKDYGFNVEDIIKSWED